MLIMINVNNNLLPSLLICHFKMLSYKIHPILCDDTHYIDSQPFKVAKAIKFDFCDQIIHLDYIVEGTVWGFRRSWGCEGLEGL